MPELRAGTKTAVPSPDREDAPIPVPSPDREDAPCSRDGLALPFPGPAAPVQQQGRFLALSLPSTAAPVPANIRGGSGTDQESCTAGTGLC